MSLRGLVLFGCALPLVLRPAGLLLAGGQAVSPNLGGIPGAGPVLPANTFAFSLFQPYAPETGQLPSLSGLRSLDAVQGHGLTPLDAPDVPASKAENPYAAMTGAVTRTYEDPGPVRKMWFVYSTAEELDRASAVLQRVKEENPGIEIVYLSDKEAFSWTQGKKHEIDTSPEAQKGLFERILKEEVGLVLASNPDTYEALRGLRDSGFAREVPFGFTGRRFVSVDMPRGSLNPGVLSDPRRLPHKKFLVLTSDESRALPQPAGMRGTLASLKQVVRHKSSAGSHGSKKEADGGFISQTMFRLGMRFSREADPRPVRLLRESAQKMAAYIEENRVDVLAIDDPETAGVVAEMKREGYHISLPVIWTGRTDPGDTSGLNLALHPAPWLARAPHVQAAKSPVLARAIEQAPALTRLPDNFMEMGGVSVREYESAVKEAVRKALPFERGASKKDKKYQIHFLLSAGNGHHRKGDANPFGHFGMAVEDEAGKLDVWTVQYNDERGGSFTGGLGRGSQLTLAEYLYGLWYLPGATGQAIPVGETPNGPVLDFVLRGVDEAALEAMRHAAAYINARHLKGEDNYEFVNKGGWTNCISMVTQILRAAGFPIAESGIQAPGDKAVEMIEGFGRKLLNNLIGPLDFGLLIFDRPPHAGSSARIWNWVLGTLFLNFDKPWKEMRWRERARALLDHPFAFLAVPRTVEAFARMASHRVYAGVGSRTLRIEENPESPVGRLRQSAVAVQKLRRERVPILEEIEGLEKEILREIGLEGWQLNPAQTLEEQAQGRGEGLAPEAQGKLEGDLKRHHELDILLALNQFDEQIELRKLEFLKLKLADPLSRHGSALKPIRAAYEGVLAYRDKIQMEDRIPTRREIQELNALNETVETELQAIRLKVLEELGPSVPHDMQILFRQVSRETLADLRQVGNGNPSSKKK